MFCIPQDNGVRNRAVGFREITERLLHISLLWVYCCCTVLTLMAGQNKWM